ncbi:hypothetical protein [Anaerosolibacter carboniphilus]|uniref:hypothetical protein n=1 Tax=Anaerosolibacter carboniphilus TaxID=1417629 RepID=UPI001A9B216E|nr:hypothetical protein [Anaerosolibacter carboniphilus]
MKMGKSYLSRMRNLRKQGNPYNGWMIGNWTKDRRMAEWSVVLRITDKQKSVGRKGPN